MYAKYELWPTDTRADVLRDAALYAYRTIDNNNITWAQKYILYITILGILYNIIVYLYRRDNSVLPRTVSCLPSRSHRRLRDIFIYTSYPSNEVCPTFMHFARNTGIHYVNYVPDPVSGGASVKMPCVILLRRYNIICVYTYI